MVNGVDDNRYDLAAEYVLGTLRGNARVQFERLLREDAEMRKRVHEWESRLFVLSDGIEPLKPHARVWKRIQARVAPRSDMHKSRIGWWRAWALAASVMLVVLSVTTLQLLQPEEGSAPAVVVLSDESSRAGWVVHADYDNKQLIAQALQINDPGEGKAFELWMLPKDEPPRSLGLLPLQGKQHLGLSADKLAVLQRSGALAVSVEPAGGSPTGLPTGPVLYQGKILEI